MKCIVKALLLSMLLVNLAQAMIVHDPKNAVQLIEQLKEMKKQYDMMMNQYKAIAGKTNIAKMFKKDYTKLWDWQKNYQKQANATDITKYHSLSSNNNYANYSDTHTKVSMVMADTVYETIDKEQKLIGRMLNDANTRETLKESMDQNSAMLVKLAQLQMEMIRVQSQQLRLQAIAQQKENVIAGWQQDFFEERVQ